MTVAHFDSFLRSHLAQVMVPLRVTSLSGRAWAMATVTTSASPRVISFAERTMREPPLKGRRDPAPTAPHGPPYAGAGGSAVEYSRPARRTQQPSCPIL